MNNDNECMYTEGLLEEFRRNIVSGRTTAKDLEILIENNSLSREQIEVVEELAPAIGGALNVAKLGAQKLGNAARNVGPALRNAGNQAVNKVKQAGQSAANSYQQGRQQTVQKNAVRALQSEYDSRFIKVIDNLLKAFPNDPTLTAYVNQFKSWVPYLTQTYFPETYSVSSPSSNNIPRNGPTNQASQGQQAQQNAPTGNQGQQTY